MRRTALWTGGVVLLVVWACAPNAPQPPTVPGPSAPAPDSFPVPDIGAAPAPAPAPATAAPAPNSGQAVAPDDGLDEALALLDEIE